ncbi:transketolase [Streptomyces sp. NBC_00249]|uniref:transketolase family protein n=1 Tax=Streptomyces sp. NBC_00249 TaxID=2975690 RepID=UPI002253EC54|nr:transketolase C-terminal domain-containing protein [Streptomyces sp. NBC_00249]MCX5192886.1 transketolase [Streptomyces sp. NBC_00249]
MTDTTTTAAVTAPPRAGREIYRDTLVELMRRDERVVCLDSDTGLFNGVEWGDERPRYINVGIAEQGLMGVAAGLAKAGRIPYVNTMATFAATRALEAVKLDIALNNLPVRIVATHGGLSAGHLGSTHHSLEDLGVMRMLPNMTVVTPADGPSTPELLSQAHALPGPVYVRLGRKATPDLPPGAPPVVIGRAQRLREGADATLVAVGSLPVLTALDAADRLAQDGVDVTVLNMHSVKPLDVDALTAAALGPGGIVTVEEHWAAGGLGSAVAEAVCRLGRGCSVRTVAVGDHFAAGTGGHGHLLSRNGITADAVVAHVKTALRAPISA